jgi:hypothetical protein
MVDLSQAFSEVKSLPDHALQNEITSPTGSIPGWLALGEIHERKRLRATTGGADQNKRPSMAEEYAGGIQHNTLAGAGLSQSSQPQQQAMPPQPPTGGGIAGLPQPQGYASGGVVGYAKGGGITSIEEYIRARAPIYGIDPDVAVRVARSEGGVTNLLRQSDVVKNGVREPSYGPFQLYMNGGLGNRALAAGIDPRTQEGGWKGIDFALSEAGQKGWGQWYGAKRVGISPMEGIGQNGSKVPVLDMASTMPTDPSAVTAAASNPTATAASGVAAAAPAVAAQAADTATQMAAAETVDPAMQQYMLFQTMFGQQQQAPAAAPPPVAQAAPRAPVDARLFGQNPEFMRRMTYG